MSGLVAVEESERQRFLLSLKFFSLLGCLSQRLATSRSLPSLAPLSPARITRLEPRISRKARASSRSPTAQHENASQLYCTRPRPPVLALTLPALSPRLTALARSPPEAHLGAAVRVERGAQVRVLNLEGGEPGRVRVVAGGERMAQG